MAERMTNEEWFRRHAEQARAMSPKEIALAAGKGAQHRDPQMAAYEDMVNAWPLFAEPGRLPPKPIETGIRGALNRWWAAVSKKKG